MFEVQYIQPATNPCLGPNASFVQTYRPPSSGMAEDRAMTARPWGMKNTRAARTHSDSDEGPECAASATQRIPTIAATLKRTMSEVLRARSTAMKSRDRSTRATIDSMAYSWETLGAEEKNAILAGIASGEATLAPRMVELNWQDRCNIDCFFCSTGEQRAGNFEMPAERVLSLFDEMRAMNVKGIRLAGGGEPLFRKDAAALVAEAGARGLRFTDVTTNGVLLTDPVARALFSAGCDEITVSLNAGTAASYERMMQTTARNFDRVVENVARAVAVRDEAHARCKIRVQFLVYRENYREIPRMLEVFRKSGADRFWLNGLFPVRPMPTMSEEDIAGMLQLYEGVLEGDYFERLESFSFWARSIASRIAESERAVFRRAPLSVRARVKWRQLFDRRQKERSAAASLHEFCLVGSYSPPIS